MLKSLKPKIKTKKQELTAEEQLHNNREKTAQQWIPIADIDDKIVYRKDNYILAMVRVQPENIDLLSDREQRRKVDALKSEWINSEREHIQIFCVGRPVDLNTYLESLQDKAKAEQDFTKKMILKGYIQQASKMASSGDIVERRFYIIISKLVVDNKSESELINRLNDLYNKLTKAELTCDICKDDEIMDVYSLFASPVQAAFEYTELELDLPPVLMI